MKPVVKWQGGKTKELNRIKELEPPTFDRIVEPFCGGASVSLSYRGDCVLNDIKSSVINLYNQIGGKNYVEIQKRIDEIKCLNHNQLEKLYYACRDIINAPDGYSNPEHAIAFIVVRQLCFSGMERYSSKGKFNVPFGHYKKMSCNLSPDHHIFFKTKAKLYNDDAISIVRKARKNDWIFLDPPYLDRLGYETGDGGEKLHRRLVNAMKKSKSKWLFIHSDCEFYREELADYNIHVKDFKYMQNFGKGKNHSGSKVQHLYITNY